MPHYLANIINFPTTIFIYILAGHFSMTKEVPKFGEKEVIQFTGVSDLSAEDQAIVHTITTEHYEKIKRDLHNLTNMTVHVKCYEKDGNRKKYSLNVKVMAPTKEFNSSNADDWELSKALHEAFINIRNQIQHRLHSNTSRPDRE